MPKMQIQLFFGDYMKTHEALYCSNSTSKEFSNS
jgi:hypothetical protein